MKNHSKKVSVRKKMMAFTDVNKAHGSLNTRNIWSHMQKVNINECIMHKIENKNSIYKYTN
jgi:hypothetical protein